MARLVTSSTGCVTKSSTVASIMRCSLRSCVGRFFPIGATWVNAMAMRTTIPRFLLIFMSPPTISQKVTLLLAAGNEAASGELFVHRCSRAP